MEPNEQLVSEDAMQQQSRVLIAEDDLSTRIILSEVLSSHGLQVVESKDGKEALEYFEACNPSIVILDYMMPELDGIEVCRRIRQSPGGKTIPVILVTSMEKSDTVALAKAAGASDFIRKPINLFMLRQRVDNLLSVHQPSRQANK